MRPPAAVRLLSNSLLPGRQKKPALRRPRGVLKGRYILASLGIVDFTLFHISDLQFEICHLRSRRARIGSERCSQAS